MENPQENELALRKKAEEIAGGCESGEIDPGPEESRRLIHELRVHQIELEIQNEKLRESQAELERSRDRYSRLFHDSPVGYAVVDSSAMTTMVNKTMADMAGAGIGDLADKPFSNLVAPSDRGIFLARFNAFFKNPNEKMLELKMQRLDGTNFFARIVGKLSDSMDLQQAGAPKTLFLSVRDVTAQKLAEEEKELLREQLIHSQKMEAIGRLAGGVAHEFNNMLGVIMGYSSLALSRMKGSDEYYFEMSQISEAAHRAKSVAMKMLAFARKGKISSKNIRIAGIVDDVAQIVQRGLTKPIVIETLVKENPVVNVDENQMFQALLNICNNACDAMPDRGLLQISVGTIDGPLEQPGADGAMMKRRKYCKVSVSDTGTGMTEAVRKKMFEPFFTTKGVGQGTGLGLAVTLGIVQNHSGHIYVSSKPGEGTTITFYIPVLEDSLEEDAALTVFPLARGTESILLVDDEEQVLNMLSLALRELGYDVSTANGGMDAVKLFNEKEGHFDLAIIDMFMPDMDGAELFDVLRYLKKDLKVLIASGHSESGATAALLSKGPCAYIQKPFTIEEFGETIRDMLDKQ